MFLVHGFGGNADHWRQNVPFLGASCRVVALDLIGYGYSSKPNPREYEQNTLYTFATWSDQILDIAERLFGPQARIVLISNSIGGIAVLEAAIKAPETVMAVQVQNISLRKLHIKNQPDVAKPAIRAFQRLLRDTFIGQRFFDAVAQPSTVKKVLQQAYH